MKWLEIIEIRSMNSNKEKLELLIQDLINKLNVEAKKQTIKAYQRVTIDTDSSIHLLHDSKEVENNGSSLGLHLASCLKEYGLVNHSIWIERDKKK